MFDLIIIGGGPAGMTAGVYAGRKMLKTLMLTESIGGKVSWSMWVENYLGYQYIPGAELVEKFKEHLENFNIEREFSHVVGLSKIDGGFVVNTKEGENYEGKAIIIATGRTQRKLSIPGEDIFLGRGVSYCVTCDGPLFKGKDVVVIGEGDSALGAALQLSKISGLVRMVSRGPLKGNEVIQRKVKDIQNIKFYINYEPVEIKGDGVVSGLVIQDKKSKQNTRVLVEGIFIEIGSVPVSVFAKDLVETNERGEIKVSCRCETSALGIFAAGDVTDAPEKQIIVAAGDGAKATLSACKYLSTLPD
ncbi:MAG TPA: thioredoxin-disulfide reductase [Actinobacteria bacterium]|nr:thioredoxin-disulfide reductase [Actinomycetota bacterium]